VTEIAINSNGQVWANSVVYGWVRWVGQVLQQDPGPTAIPVPIDIRCSPSLPAISKTAPVGSFVAVALVTMSNRSAFNGTISVGPDTAGKGWGMAAGNVLTTSVSPISDVGMAATFCDVTATQGGYSIATRINPTFI
jgi:hypothetical protein